MKGRVLRDIVARNRASRRPFRPLDMDVVESITSVSAILEKSKDDYENLLKSHEVLQAQHAKLQEANEAEKQEKSDLLACMDSLHSQCSEHSSMLQSLEEAVTALAAARLESARAAQAAAEFSSKVKKLECQKSALQQDMERKLTDSAREVESQKHILTLEISALKEQHALACDQMAKAMESLQKETKQQASPCACSFHLNESWRPK